MVKNLCNRELVTVLEILINIEAKTFITQDWESQWSIE